LEIQLYFIGSGFLSLFPSTWHNYEKRCRRAFQLRRKVTMATTMREHMISMT